MYKRKLLRYNFTYYPSIFLEGLIKLKKYLRVAGLRGRGSKAGPPECGALIT